MGKLIQAVVVILLVIPSTIWKGYVLSIIWRWFVSDVFGVQELGVVSAMGLSLVVSMFTPLRYSEEDDTVMVKCIIAMILGPLFALGLGWVLKAFM
jgi:hypothetical protein